MRVEDERVGRGSEVKTLVFATAEGTEPTVKVRGTS